MHPSRTSGAPNYVHHDFIFVGRTRRVQPPRTAPTMTFTVDHPVQTSYPYAEQYLDACDSIDCYSWISPNLINHLSTLGIIFHMAAGSFTTRVFSWNPTISNRSVVVSCRMLPDLNGVVHNRSLCMPPTKGVPALFMLPALSAACI